jgi:rhodanese-related sulfurtransferase
MTPADVQQAIAAGSVLLDMRLPRIFAREHVPGAVNLQFNRADLVDRAELVLPKDASFIVHAEPEAIAKSAVDLLAAAGFTVQGFLTGGLAAWKASPLPTARIEVLGVDELQDRLQELQVVDAREPFEFKYGHVPGAKLLPWTEAWENGPAFTSDRPVAVICGDEVRSALVASILARSLPDVRLVTGGMVDWNERGLAVEKGQAAANV